MFFSITLVGSSQEFNSKDDLKVDLESLLPNGDIKLLVNEAVVASGEADAIRKKIEAAFNNHPNWFMEQAANREKGKLLPYHTNLGIDKNEYEFLKKSHSFVAFKVIDSLSLNIQRSDSKIHITPSKDAHFKTFHIDLETKIAQVDSIQIPFDKIISIDASDNVLESAWKGYSWSLEYPTDDDSDQHNDLEGIDLGVFKITIGKTETAQRLYISIEMGAFVHWEKIINYKYRLLSPLKN